MESHYNQILDILSDLKEQVKAIGITKLDPYNSSEIKDLAAAFAKAQAEYPELGANRENPYFKSSFTDINAIMMPIRPILAKHGLSFYQYIDLTGEQTVLHSKLIHASGQWISSRARIIPAKNDIQTYGSTLSYHKRYAAMALLNITCNADRLDDDGEVAMVETRGMIAKGPSAAPGIKYDPKKESNDTVTREQLEELEYELEEYPDIAENILDKLMLQSLADLPKSKYQATVTRIREIKVLRNTGGK